LASHSPPSTSSLPIPITATAKRPEARPSPGGAHGCSTQGLPACLTRSFCRQMPM
jgi:hypothetical protein